MGNFKVFNIPLSRLTIPYSDTPLHSLASRSFAGGGGCVVNRKEGGGGKGRGRRTSRSREIARGAAAK